MYPQSNQIEKSSLSITISELTPSTPLSCLSFKCTPKHRASTQSSKNTSHASFIGLDSIHLCGYLIKHLPNVHSHTAAKALHPTTSEGATLMDTYIHREPQNPSHSIHRPTTTTLDTRLASPAGANPLISHHLRHSLFRLFVTYACMGGVEKRRFGG